MRLIYLGTPDFAVPTLEALVRAGHQVVLVATMPDRPKGRGQKLAPPPVKEAALRHGLEVIQPEKFSAPEVFERLADLRPEALVVAAFGALLKKNVIDLPTRGCVNVHSSLLPRHRGAAPIRWAILRGDRVTGVTTMMMDVGMDTGPILLQRSIPIAPDDTNFSLSQKLADLGAGLLVETLAGLESGALSPTAQDDAQATYAPKLMKEDGHIEWFLSAEKLGLVIRAFDPWPGAFTNLEGESIKILKAVPEPLEPPAPHGTVLSADKAGLLVACGQGALRVLELQAPGKRRMSAAEFLAGRHLAPGSILG